MLSMAMCALGNRCWGADGLPRWLAVLMMTYGLVLAHPHMWARSPLIAVWVYVFRIFATGETWLAAARGEHIPESMLRSAAIIPLALLLYTLDGHPWHLMAGALFPVITLIYCLCGQQKQVEPIALAELLTGAWLALI